MGRGRRGRRTAGGLCGLLLVASAAGAGAAGAYPDTPALDCLAPAPEAAPGTEEWHARDAANVACAEQRLTDTAMHPFITTTTRAPVYDPYREPQRHAGKRFRYFQTTVTSERGDALPVEVYAPCTPTTCKEMPAGLAAHTGRFPGVLIQHGGYQATKELHWWAAQSLAEAGYMTVALTAPQDGEAFFEDSRSVLQWFAATPTKPAPDGFNPLHAELDRNRIGMAGHSGGGATSNRHGAETPLVKAVVAWDRSGRYGLPKRITVPSLYVIADHGFTPEAQQEPPNPQGYVAGTVDPGDKHQDYDRAVADGIDSMKLVLRAATHLDWVPRASAASRYGEAVSMYYTLAWFDRYLKGRTEPQAARDGYRRLTAPVFDGSSDQHNISQGVFDPALAAQSGEPYGGNRPYLLQGLPVRDRLSFYYLSKCSLRPPTGKTRSVSGDMRAAGCPAA